MDRRRVRALTIASIIVAAAGVASCGGGDDTQTTAEETPVNAAPAATEPEANAPAEADAVAAIEAWAGPVRAAGHSVTYDEAAAATLANLEIAGADGFGIVWTAPEVGEVSVDGDTLRFVPTGAGSLTLQFGTEGLAFAFEAGEVDVLYSADGDAGAALIFAFSDVVTAAGTIDALTVESRLAAGAAAAYDVTIDGFALSDPETGGALGPQIAAMHAVLQQPAAGAASGEFTVATLSVEWGTLRMTGAGTMARAEPGAWTGRLDVEIVDPLSLLDAIRASHPLDLEAMAETYAAILEEMGEAADPETQPFSLRIDAGAVTLLGEPRGVPDLELGIIAPLLAGAVIQ